jgi:hypothetical protein
VNAPEVRNLLRSLGVSHIQTTADAIQRVFSADHRRFQALGRKLHRALEASVPDNGEALWNELSAALSIHLHAEEMFMVPALGRARPRDARAILAEHRLIRERLTEMDARLARREICVDLMRDFVEELDAHARHEEKIFHTWAENWLDAEERALLIAYCGRASSDSSVASSSWTFTGLVR